MYLYLILVGILSIFMLSVRNRGGVGVGVLLGQNPLGIKCNKIYLLVVPYECFSISCDTFFLLKSVISSPTAV